jgi:urea transport system permease protein
MRFFLQRLPQRFLTAALTAVFAAVLCLPLAARAALPQALIEKLALGESEDKIAAIGEVVTAADPEGLVFLQSLLAGEVQTVAEKQVLIVKDGKAVDAVTGAAVSPLPEGAEEVTLNNRLRREVEAAIAALGLVSTDRAARLAAAKALEGGADEGMLPILARALAKESDPEIKALLSIIQASVQLKSSDAAVRLAAVRALAGSSSSSSKTALLALLEKKGDAWTEPDPAVRAEAQISLEAVERRLVTGQRIGQVFSGASLGSILLLAALGLAITYGLMGVINMAHGELIMIGAYTTYLVQNLFRSYMPGAFDWYLLAAVPLAFMVSALVGMVLERVVIRFLYGRPLETLLATWGISLMLIQGVRTLFGAQNVQVENPVWMSGGVELLSNVVLPYSRIVIIGFSGVVLLLVWLALTRTRLGLFVRGVTQNRAIASCMGVHTARVDTWCFGLGSGIAGLAGCALSQIGNVGPDLGQGYIVDSFMVVVLGGVGQLAGTVYAALGLGVVNKFLEGWAGAVIAKIIVLVFIIIFIQKRPQGLFALKGRFADA